MKKLLRNILFCVTLFMPFLTYAAIPNLCPQVEPRIFLAGLNLIYGRSLAPETEGSFCNIVQQSNPNISMIQCNQNGNSYTVIALYQDDTSPCRLHHYICGPQEPHCTLQNN